ncbi:PepSY-associated TM helix domain-containing protein [Bradyrhizobium sp. JYMT SZCCT0180]|uniref:PepSY-associated TM helix domain-containing protein n=1 Tax=Bradyrhizobium sp. JYMT SZCCT0180 TaxID=2807666 RepID=UPI001BA6B5AB|nr:PepSY-associated TM helix domain-containing protein [Bradyrhizobium sp. JYMT SZCCT0180]MBR1215035.1 PepSY domain-containing protein [Bradyrhizobium sp. JYMT SZCCT0180]
MTPATRSLRRWGAVHKWTSLICTIFMLMLCITGLPLIFHHEIDELLHSEVKPAEVAPGTPFADLDKLLANAMANAPKNMPVPHFLIWDRDDPNAMFVSVGESLTSDPTNNRFVRMDSHTGAYLDSPDVTGRFTYIMLKLHTDMFAGLPGKLFLGLMGILFCVAIISGIVVYAPSMRKLDFGAYRGHRPRIVRWLDIHNLAGILLVMWTLVVGFTGVINTWADLVLKMWQYGQLAEMTSQYKDRAPPTKLTSLQSAVTVATDTVPGMTPSFVAFPGTLFSSKSHYAVFLKGDTPVTSRLLKPALIDAETGKLTDSRDMPWYVTTLFISQPLHFGDYGGMPLKTLWALLDVLTIIVLGTGVYLWLRRRKTGVSVDRAIAQGSALDTPVLSR